MEAVFLVVGIIFGVVSSCCVFFRLRVGKLHVDYSDPDGTYLFLELNKDLNDIDKEDYIVLKVDAKPYISRK